MDKQKKEYNKDYYEQKKEEIKCQKKIYYNIHLNKDKNKKYMKKTILLQNELLEFIRKKTNIKQIKENHKIYRDTDLNIKILKTNIEILELIEFKNRLKSKRGHKEKSKKCNKKEVSIYTEEFERHSIKIRKLRDLNLYYRKCIRDLNKKELTPKQEITFLKHKRRKEEALREETAITNKVLSKIYEFKRQNKIEEYLASRNKY